MHFNNDYGKRFTFDRYLAGGSELLNLRGVSVSRDLTATELFECCLIVDVVPVYGQPTVLFSREMISHPHTVNSENNIK